MSLNILECQVSTMVDSDTCPRPTTKEGADAGVGLAKKMAMAGEWVPQVPPQPPQPPCLPSSLSS